MIFQSIQYLIFLCTVLALQFLCPKKMKPYLLLGASWFFYSQWNQLHLIILITITIITFYFAKIVQSSSRKQCLIFYLGCGANLSILFTFKYLGFFQEIALSICSLLDRPLYLRPIELLLPVGISFYTLQALSYLIDVNQQKLHSERNFLSFANYLAFFPQLIAGPIERASHLLPQLNTNPRSKWSSIKDGSRRILWGLFKKVVIADRIAPHVQWILLEHPGPDAATIFWAGVLGNILIYADFSAYSDIAIGSARMMGIHIRENFKFPLFSQSMPDFWRRWHISLHRFFIDYVYKPIGGGQCSGAQKVLNIAIVFLISGLWHGAAWNFIIWSLFHLTCVLVHIFVVNAWNGLGYPTPKHWTWTFFSITIVHAQRGLSMILFFVPEVERGLELFISALNQTSTINLSNVLPYPALVQIIIMGGCLALLVVETMHMHKPLSMTLSRWPRGIRWACYQITILAIMIFGVESNNPFIYFQF